MPRLSDAGGARPRQRRGRKAKRVVTTERERGLVMRLLLHSPKDTVAGVLALAAVLAVVVNAMFLQGGRHPSPMFGDHVLLLKPVVDPAPPAALSPAMAPASPLPRPRPAAADRRSDVAPIDAPAQHHGDPIGHLVRKVAARSDGSAGDIRTEAAPSRRVMAVQRLLSDYGYGQLAPSGQIDAATRAAIRKFEVARHLPVTGQVSDRLLGELAAVTGRRLD